RQFPPFPLISSSLSPSPSSLLRRRSPLCAPSPSLHLPTPPSLSFSPSSPTAPFSFVASTPLSLFPILIPPIPFLLLVNSKMTPCPRSPHIKMTPLRTAASTSRWKEMMSQGESSRAPESSHPPSPLAVSQGTEPPSSSHRAPTHVKKKKRRSGFLWSRSLII
ncbi:hypothetical protein LINGRAPRIM_LOCUS2287, partial [Linum grandiflorum]